MTLPQAPPPQPPAPAPRACALCDTALEPSQLRCPSCGLHQELGPERPNPFRQRALWLLIGVLATLYITVLLVVWLLPPA